MTLRSHRSRPIGIAGAGRVAQALGRLLHQQGECIGFIASRNPRHAEEAARFVGSDVEPVEFADLPRKASRLIIAVPETALASIIHVLAQSAEPGGVAVHTSGARDVEDFGPLRNAGYACGTFHPLQTIADRDSAAMLGAIFAVSGDGPAVQWATDLAACLGGRAVTLPAGSRPLYHAAAVMASNYSVALLDAASELMATATDGSQAEALEMLAPLARAALENVLQQGPVAALTGPIERGDTSTVALHLAALGTAPERIRKLYAVAGLQTLDLARRRGLSDEAASALEEILYDQK